MKCFWLSYHKSPVSFELINCFSEVRIRLGLIIVFPVLDLTKKTPKDWIEKFVEFMLLFPIEDEHLLDAVLILYILELTAFLFYP